MGKTPNSLLISAICLASISGFSQSKVRISEPRLEFAGSMIQISYDITNGNPGEKYVISLDVRDEKGIPVNADSLSGDIGMVEESGPGKRIAWNLEADSIFMDAWVFVKIHARVIPPPEPEITKAEIPETEAAETGEPLPRNQDPAVWNEVNPVNVPATGDMEGGNNAPVTGAGRSGAESFSRAGLMLQSLALPGLGLTRATGQPHWIRAVAGYGCIAGAVVMNRKGISVYRSVDAIRDPVDAEDTFRRSVKYDNLSEAFAYAAAGIWVADAIWTFAGTQGFRNTPVGRGGPGILLRAGFEPQMNIPLVSFRYKF